MKTINSLFGMFAALAFGGALMTMFKHQSVDSIFYLFIGSVFAIMFLFSYGISKILTLK